MKSSSNTSSATKPLRMAVSTSEPSAACTASHKQDYWPTNSSKKVSTNTDTNKASWYLAFGNTTQDQYYHTGCQWLRCEIHWQRTCTTSQECTQRILQPYMRLDRQRVHRDNIGLGLQKVPGSSINAKLCAESLETILTQSGQTTACTISKCINPMWHKETICNTRFEGATIRWQSQAVHPTGMWQVFIPWQSGW